ncbi:Protein GrpE [bacterium HR10]|nr:Protein GrpE [bacterium HR10]
MEKPNARRIPIRFVEHHEEAPAEYPVRPPETEREHEAEGASEPEAEELSATIREIGREVIDAHRPEVASVPEDEITRLRQEREALYERLLRLAAEFENYRKRIERERERMREEALVEVLTEFLPIVDDFERALEAARWLRDLDGVLHGLTVIHRRLLELLARFNVRPMETLGRPFDPTRHEAFAVEPTDEYEENTIIDEYQRGYLMGDRLLRPARVKVAVRPTSKRA